LSPDGGESLMDAGVNQQVREEGVAHDPCVRAKMESARFMQPVAAVRIAHDMIHISRKPVPREIMTDQRQPG
jgi:hypothetical protein